MAMGATAPDPAPPEVDTPRTPRLRVAPSTIVLFGVVFWIVPLLGLLAGQYVDILLVVFLAILLSTFLDPAVSRLQRFHLHRGVAILLIYLIALAALALLARLALPLFTGETRQLATSLPAMQQKIEGVLRSLGIPIPAGGRQGLNIGRSLTGGENTVVSVAGNAATVLFAVGQALVFLASILVMAFFLTVRETFAADLVNILVPPAHRARTIDILSKMGQRMGRWVIGQAAITIYYAVAFSTGLTLLGVPYALSVGVITGALEIIPFVGGFIGVALAILVAAGSHPAAIIPVIVLYLVVTNVEAHILVPLVYGKAVHLHPFLVIVALLVGAKAFGLLGALIAVPIAAALQAAVESLYIRDVVEAAERRERRPKRPAIDLTVLRRIRTR